MEVSSYRVQVTSLNHNLIGVDNRSLVAKFSNNIEYKRNYFILNNYFPLYDTISSYIYNCDSLYTRTDHYMLLSIVLHIVVPLYSK